MKKIIIAIIVLSMYASVGSAQQYGIVCGKCEDKFAAVRTTGVTWLRTDIILSQYKGNNFYKMYYDSGFNIIVTVHWLSGNKDVFIKDTDLYKSKLDNFISNNLDASHKCKLFIVVGNEEVNSDHNSGTAVDYLNMLNAAISVAEKYNLPISNGGITFSTLKLKIYVDEMDAHRWNDAHKFASMCISRRVINKLQSPKSKLWPKLNFIDTVINAFSQINYPLFSTNFHYYAPAKFHKGTLKDSANEDSSYVWLTTINYLKEHTNRDSLHIISNEMGQTNYSGPLLKSELVNAAKNNVQIIVWHAGDDAPAVGIFSNYHTLSLRDNGIAFKKFITK